MAKRIITISREFGSGGRFIGEEVAQQLGIAYYSENIIDQKLRLLEFIKWIKRCPHLCREILTVRKM